jgi:hypothetical protein
MVKKLTILILAGFLLCSVAAARPSEKMPKGNVAPPPKAKRPKGGTTFSKKADTLRDGFALTGVDGKLLSVDDKWFFKLDRDLEDDKGIIKAKSEIEFLPSSTLEKIITSSQNRTDNSYRLWGKVTTYKGKNYFFSIYFLPISEVKKSESKQPGQPGAINDTNDALTVPEELVAKLSAQRVITTEELKEGLEIKTDSILADRTGFLEKRADGQMMFTLDGFGRNFPRISIRLMPCSFLEDAQEKQTKEPDRLRFKVAGVVTRYKGENYLLLHRIVRIYNNGNFPG